MGGSFGSNLGMDQNELSAPGAVPLPQGNAGYGGKGTQWLAAVSATLGGLRQGHMARMARDYSALERQYRVASASATELERQLNDPSTDENRKRELIVEVKIARDNLQKSYDALMSFGGGGKGKKGEQEGMKGKIGEFIKRLLIGADPTVGKYPSPASRPGAGMPGAGTVAPGPPGSPPAAATPTPTFSPMRAGQQASHVQGLFGGPGGAVATSMRPGQTMLYRGQPVVVRSVNPDGTVEIDFQGGPSGPPGT